MRATYEDLLQVARRCAVEAEKTADADPSDVVAGWQATLTAARRHFRWLRLDLATADLGEKATRQADGPMHVLAQTIGAGADLLAGQAAMSKIVFDNRWVLGAARSELAAITAIGARAAMARLSAGQRETDGSRARLYKHLVDVGAELDFLRGRGRGIRSLGRFGGLSTSSPGIASDEPSAVMRLAAQWGSIHLATSPCGLLTRDLRSTTAQLRTVCGYASHLGGVLRKASGTQVDDLHELELALRNADAATARVGRLWRNRLSDLNGRTEVPAEPVFLEMLSTLQRWVRNGERLRHPDEIVGSEESIAACRDVLDELLHAGDRVAAAQNEAVTWLIDAGHLFVPRPELAKRDPEYRYKPERWLQRYPQPHWVRTNRRACFDELSASIADSARHLAVAADIARRLAGSTEQSRPVRLVRAAEPRYPRKSLWRPPEAAFGDLTSSELAGPKR